MKLHVGCGKVIIPNWTNLDIQNNLGVDIVDDAKSLCKIKDASCDIIYACHILEHFSRNEVADVIETWYKKIKVGGSIRLAVPDFEKVIRWYSDTGKIEDVLGLLVGGHKDEWDKHGMIFDKRSLSNMLSKAGFHSIVEWDWKKTEHIEYDDFSQAYMPHMEKESGMLMSLNLEARK